jgi:hypothetical protein
LYFQDAPRRTRTPGANTTSISLRRLEEVTRLDDNDDDGEGDDDRPLLLLLLLLLPLLLAGTASHVTVTWVSDTSSTTPCRS